jgi:hypothetical protein
MRKSTKRLLGGVALAAGAFGAAGAYLTKKKKNVNAKHRQPSSHPGSVWARPSMTVTFRAELMPGRDRDERTFRVKALLKNGRVLLDGVAGEHGEKEFEPIR